MTYYKLVASNFCILLVILSGENFTREILKFTYSGYVLLDAHHMVFIWIC